MCLTYTEYILHINEICNLLLLDPSFKVKMIINKPTTGAEGFGCDINPCRYQITGFDELPKHTQTQNIPKNNELISHLVLNILIFLVSIKFFAPYVEINN